MINCYVNIFPSLTPKKITIHYNFHTAAMMLSLILCIVGYLFGFKRVT